jgi:hypothetical protein
MESSGPCHRVPDEARRPTALPKSAREARWEPQETQPFVLSVVEHNVM